MKKSQIRRIINDLHTIADVLEKNPELNEPSISDDYEGVTVRFHYYSADAAARIANDVRLFPGMKFNKNDPKKDDFEKNYYTLTAKLDVLNIQFLAPRATVCQRVVTATETVTEEVPDPAEVAKLPTIKHERTVETVEWQCVPLLAKVLGQPEDRIRRQLGRKKP